MANGFGRKPSMIYAAFNHMSSSTSGQSGSTLIDADTDIVMPYERE